MKIFSLLLLLLTLAGCVERSFQVDSQPRGALVVLDEIKIGYTPITIPFSHYGVRQLRIEKLGYEKKTIITDIEKPWYEAPVLDFFSDVLWPFVIEDKHPFYVELKLLKEESAKGLMERAGEAREVLRGEKGS